MTINPTFIEKVKSATRILDSLKAKKQIGGYSIYTKENDAFALRVCEGKGTEFDGSADYVVNTIDALNLLVIGIRFKCNAGTFWDKK